MAAYPTLVESRNVSEGIHTILTYVAEVVPLFIPMILFAVFIVTFLGSYFAQMRFRARADFFASFAASSYVVAVISIIMTLVEGLININVVFICLAVSLIATLLLFVSSKA